MKKFVELLLVKPGNQKKLYGPLSESFSAIEPPFWAGLIAAFAREKGHSVAIIDAEAENLSPEETAEKIAQLDPGLMVIIASGTNPSASTMSMTGARSILEALYVKKLRAKTMLAGLHPSSLPKRTLIEERVDFVCEGEGFFTIPEVVEALKRKRNFDGIKGLWYRDSVGVVSNERSPNISDLDKIPFAAWDLLPMNLYRAHNWHCFGRIDDRKPYAVIYTSLGCPFNCSFCCINSIFGKPGIRYRSPEKVVDEIGLLVKEYGVKNIKILDELFVLKEDHVNGVCDLIIERGYDLNMWAYARVDTVNEKMFFKMKRAGVNWVCFGIEASDDKVRAGVSKGRFGNDAIRRAIEIARKADMNVLGNFMFGLPDDNLETMRETLRMAKSYNFEYANFYTTMAYPGSRLYEEALRSGVALPETWSGYSQLGEDSFPLPTKYLSNADVLWFRDAAFEDYYSDPRYLDMIGKRFGGETVEHIKKMLNVRINRKLLEKRDASKEVLL